MILQWTARVHVVLERHDQGGVVPYHPAVLVKRWCTSTALRARTRSMGIIAV
jgi:hypothetical protein